MASSVRVPTWALATLAGVGLVAALSTVYRIASKPAAPLKAFILIVRLSESEGSSDARSPLHNKDSHCRAEIAPGKMAEFLELWQPLAAHCQANEPDTFSYEAAISDKDTDVVIIFERYRSKSALTGTQNSRHIRSVGALLQMAPGYAAGPHQSSEPFKQFRQQLEKSGIVVEKSGESYIESNVGFMTRS